MANKLDESQESQGLIQSTGVSAFEKQSQNAFPNEDNTDGHDQGEWNSLRSSSNYIFFRKLPTYIQRIGLYIWFRGPLATFISATLGAYAQFLCKNLIRDTFPSLEVSFLISIFSLILCLLQARITRIPKKEWVGQRVTTPYLLARGIFGAISNTLFFLSLAYLQLAEAELIFFLNPIFIVPLAVIYLEEPVGTFTLLSYFVAIGGFVLVEKPGFLFEDQDWSYTRIMGVILGILGALSAACSYISISMVGDYEFAVVFNGYFYLFCSVSSLIVGPIVQGFIVPQFKDILLVLAISLFHYSGQLLLTRGFQISKAVTVATINYSNVVYSYLYDTIFFGNEPDFYGILGSDLIFASLFMVNADKKIDLHRQEVEAEEKTRLLQEEEEEMYGIDRPLAENDQEIEDQEQQDSVPNLNQIGRPKSNLETSRSHQELLLSPDKNNPEAQKGINLQYHSDLEIEPQEGGDKYVNRYLSHKLDNMLDQQQKDPKDRV